MRQEYAFSQRRAYGLGAAGGIKPPAISLGGRMRGVSGFGGGYQLCQPEGDAGAGGDHRRARDPASDLLRQRAGVLRPWGISTPVKVGSCRGIGG